MSFIDLFILAVGLSMDAFAVSICKGLAAKKVGIPQMCCAGLWFGGFQALMPFIGWLLGSRFRTYIEDFDHWIAFILLAIIGINMLRESFSEKKEDPVSSSFNIKTMFLMAVATSIDALAVGITFGLLLNSFSKIISACIFICSVTFCFSAAGVKIGSIFGAAYKKKAEILGGIILIFLGIKILIEHLFFS
ncbi:MAG: manganese efflux pump MntP family protein [Treponema sp.]|nr:manganese efflux pump MntP family protein [Treponema sp.]